MSDKMRAHFTGILNKWKQELMEEVDRTVHHMQDEAANFPDPADRASQEEEFSLELRARDRERKLIKKIDETLQLIEDNEYGWCDSCGVEIGIRRLEARPTATLCIDCKTLAEIRKSRSVPDPERGATAPRFIPGPAPFHPPRHHRSRRPAMSSSAPPQPARYIGRFAPTPSGYLHFGSLALASISTPVRSAFGCCAWKTSIRHGRCPAPAGRRRCRATASNGTATCCARANVTLRIGTPSNGCWMKAWRMRAPARASSSKATGPLPRLLPRRRSQPRGCCHPPARTRS